jgi:phosphatidate cytidylyltransferase
MVCCAPLWFFSGVLLICTGLGLYEYFSLTTTSSVSTMIGVTWGMAIAIAVAASCASLVAVALTVGLFVFFVLALRDPWPAHGVADISSSLLGVVYVGFLLPHLILLRHSPEGAWWVLFVFLVAMLGDTGGYAVGRLWGSHKLIPHISPGKTVEGSVGAVVGNLGAAALASVWLLPARSTLEVVTLALAVGAFAQVGDLCESALKRAFGAKDAGGLFPGHGGMLDRIDSLLFSGAFLYYYVIAWG